MSANQPGTITGVDGRPVEFDIGNIERIEADVLAIAQILVAVADGLDIAESVALKFLGTQLDSLACELSDQRDAYNAKHKAEAKATNGRAKA